MRFSWSIRMAHSVGRFPRSNFRTPCPLIPFSKTFDVITDGGRTRIPAGVGSWGLPAGQWKMMMVENA